MLLTCQVIVVDWNKQATKFHPQNALILKKWKGADDDTALLDLANLLQSKLTLIEVLSKMVTHIDLKNFKGFLIILVDIK